MHCKRAPLFGMSGTKLGARHPRPPRFAHVAVNLRQQRGQYMEKMLSIIIVYSHKIRQYETM